MKTGKTGYGSFLILAAILFTGLLQDRAWSADWSLSLGAGATNHWFDKDIDNRMNIEEIRLACGKPLSSHVSLALSADYTSFDLDEGDHFESFGLTPLIRYTRGSLFVEGGIGLMRNDFHLEGFTYEYKWSPQAGVGFKVMETEKISLVVMYALTHFSHSFLSEKRNVGINANNVRVTLFF